MNDTCAPADAYYEVAEILGDGYFLIAPPDVGTELTIMGRDRVPTVWTLPTPVALEVAKRVSQMRGLRLVSSRSYYSSPTSPKGF